MLRRTHPLVPALVGVVGGFLAFIASKQRMHELAPSFIERQGIERFSGGSDDWWPDATVGHVDTVAVVAIVCWIGVLVLRGAASRVAAVLATLASLVAAVVLLVNAGTGRDAFGTEVGRKLGMESLIEHERAIDPTSWFWACLIGCVVSAIAGVVAYQDPDRLPAPDQQDDVLD